MKYATPELVLLGTASALVQGSEIQGQGDNAGESLTSKPATGLVLGLD